MPKLANITAAALKESDDAGSDLCMKMHDFNRRMEGGYIDPVEAPLQLARSFLSLSRAAADLAAGLMCNAALDEMRCEAEAAIRALKPQS